VSVAVELSLRRPTVAAADAARAVGARMRSDDVALATALSLSMSQCDSAAADTKRAAAAAPAAAAAESKADDDDETDVARRCVVCFLPFGTMILRSLPCAHTFHDLCLRNCKALCKREAGQPHRCPVCRTAFDD
jgi:hypothetical protein